VPKADTKALVDCNGEGVSASVVKGVAVWVSGGESSAAVSMICPGGVISGSSGCVVLDYQLCQGDPKMAHLGGVTFLLLLG